MAIAKNSNDQSYVTIAILCCPVICLPSFQISFLNAFLNNWNRKTNSLSLFAHFSAPHFFSFYCLFFLKNVRKINFPKRIFEYNGKGFFNKMQLESRIRLRPFHSEAKAVVHPIGTTPAISRSIKSKFKLINTGVCSWARFTATGCGISCGKRSGTNSSSAAIPSNSGSNSERRVRRRFVLTPQMMPRGNSSVVGSRT